MGIKTEHAVCEDCERDIEELGEAVVLKTCRKSPRGADLPRSIYTAIR